MKKNNLALIKQLLAPAFRVIIVLACLLLSVYVSFSWLSNNNKVNSGGMSISAADPGTLELCPTVYATFHNLKDATYTVNTYSLNENGVLCLQTSEKRYESSGMLYETQPEFTLGDPFSFSEIIPFEYVDIAIGIRVPEKHLGKNLVIDFMDFNTESNCYFEFARTMDGEKHKHSTIGVYKWKALSLKTALDSEVSLIDYSAAEYKYFGSYNIDSDDDVFTDDDYSVRMLDTVVTGDFTGEDYVFYTFRIMEDFTNYQQHLLIYSSDTVANPLSEKQFYVQTIMFNIKD